MAGELAQILMASSSKFRSLPKLRKNVFIFSYRFGYKSLFPFTKRLSNISARVLGGKLVLKLYTLVSIRDHRYMIRLMKRMSYREKKRVHVEHQALRMQERSGRTFD